MMEYLRFGELYAIPSSNGLSRPSAVRGAGYKMVNMGELFSNGIINDIPMERVQMSDKELSKFLLEKGDLLFARQSLVAEGAGKCSYVNDLTEETTFESHLIRVRLNPKRAISKYFYYLFQLPNNPIKTIVNQCAQAGIRGSELIRVKVPCPSIKVQKKIASILSAYDSQIENNQKRIKILEQMAENLYKEWFVRFRFPGFENTEFEGGVPKGWKMLPLSDLLIDGFNGGWGEDNQTDKCSALGYVIRGTDIDDVKAANYKGVPLRFHKESDIEKKQLIANDVILELSNGNINNIGRTLFVTKDILDRLPNVMSASFCKTLRFVNPYDAYVVYRHITYMQNSGLLSFYKNTGANGINNFNYKRFLRHRFVIPNDERIVKELMEIDKLISKLANCSNNLITQRDLLLPRLMSGKLSI